MHLSETPLLIQQYFVENSNIAHIDKFKQQQKRKVKTDL